MLKVGVTGGIGSGKTTVCKIFEVLGIPVYYADDRAKALMNSDEGIVSAVKEIFGEEAYAGGKLNRQYISSKVFNNKPLLAKLNAVVHPAVAIDVRKWMSGITGKPYVIQESALLYESGSYKQLDKIIVVYAPQEQRVKRIKARDNVSYEEVISRMKNQLPDEEKKKMADFVIYNDDRHSLIRQVLVIHHILAG